MVREPAVAGRFYPGNETALRSEVERLVGEARGAKDCIGCIVPHAGYVYSGRIAGRVYASVEVPDRAIVLCPNHTGRGARISLFPEGAWETPLGAVPIDAELVAALSASGAMLDVEAHRSEHALEVQLPFLLSR